MHSLVGRPGPITGFLPPIHCVVWPHAAHTERLNRTPRNKEILPRLQMMCLFFIWLICNIIKKENNYQAPLIKICLTDILITLGIWWSYCLKGLHCYSFHGPMYMGSRNEKQGCLTHHLAQWGTTHKGLPSLLPSKHSSTPAWNGFWIWVMNTFHLQTSHNSSSFADLQCTSTAHFSCFPTEPPLYDSGSTHALINHSCIP